MSLNSENYLELLKNYSGLTNKLPQSSQEKQELKEAILWLCQQSESENLGICSDRLDEAELALKQYLSALGYQVTLEEQMPSLEGPVYLKFNTQKMSLYRDRYDGTYRGVLIACQAEDEQIAGTYGHFPLDLFDLQS